MSKKDMNYKSLDSLKPIESVINEAAEAIKDPSRTIVESAIPEVLAGVAGAAIGGAASFTALWALGTSAATMFSLSGAGIMGGMAAAGGIVGGGAVAGVFVLAAPVAILAGAGVGIAAHVKNKKLSQEKERLYKEALKKHDAIINELNDKDKLSNERIEYLNSLNILLRQAIKELKSDLEAA
jgi:hypothetical protein